MSGDIVRIGDKVIGYIEYDPRYAAYILRGTGKVVHEFENFGDYLVCKVEILGNIYENPELLGGE